MWEGFVTAIVCCWKMLLYFVGLALGAAFSLAAVAFGLVFTLSVIDSINARKSE